ncbi:M15 family metallopeptidase [Camelliibacillus cellulosilyticus]|uniref:M15 family metallopeptidase n=1 Tax=Camelliibacillus cellulosilyticus TaxID=2174486 RepID=UPI00366F8DD0
MSISEDDKGFINVAKIDSSIIIDLKYATSDNFTKQPIYDFTVAVARVGTAKKLGVAAKILREKGFRIVVWDAYRPSYAQKRLFEVYPDPMWVAPPNPNHSHEKGVTFDVTLADLDGNEIEMQSPFDDFSGAAKRNAVRTPLQEYRYQVLLDAMTKAGFKGYENEWWDYQDTDADLYGPMQVNPNDYI